MEAPSSKKRDIGDGMPVRRSDGYFLPGIGRVVIGGGLSAALGGAMRVGRSGLKSCGRLKLNIILPLF